MPWPPLRGMSALPLSTLHNPTRPRRAVAKLGRLLSWWWSNSAREYAMAPKVQQNVLAAVSLLAVKLPEPSDIPSSSERRSHLEELATRAQCDRR